MQERVPGAFMQDVLRNESENEPVPGVLLESSYKDLGSEDLPRERYFSREYHDLEVERMWRRVWQMACREEDIPGVGDTLVYDIADDSIVLVRVGPDQIKGYYNACLHRGAQLRAEDGYVPMLECSFHGWTWNLDGELVSIPGRWDFSHVEREQCRLPEVKVECWDGWVFINMCDDAGPLADYLENLPELMAPWPMKDRVKVAHVMARVPCNWKVLLEAFIETYHVSRTHPQFLYYNEDVETQCDVYGDHVSRMISPLGFPSSTLVEEVDPEELAKAIVRDFAMGDPASVRVEPGESPRRAIADTVRRGVLGMTGVDLTAASTSEMVDGIEHLLFPNFVPWGGYSIPIVYRYRPDGSNPDSAIADVMLLAPIPPGVPRPPAAKARWLEGDDWTAAPEIGLLAAANNQDMANLARVQRGLKTSRKAGVTLGNYQEVRIRHHAQTLSKYLGEEGA